MESGAVLSKKKNIIVFDLYRDDEIKRVLMRAFIAGIGPDGKPRKWKRYATPENVSVQSGLGDISIIEPLLQHCLELEPTYLQKKYNPKGRKRYSWSEILNDVNVKAQVYRWIDMKMSSLLSNISQQSLALTKDCQRHDILSMNEVIPTAETLSPTLKFRKTDDGLIYQLVLLNEGTEIIPLRHRTEVVSDKPGWAVIDKKLYQLAGLNGNKLKPFTKKESIHIKPALIETYFKKFIIEVAEKAEIEAQGFEINEYTEVIESLLELTHDFTKDIYLLRCMFDYGPASFSSQNPAKHRKKLKLQDDQVSIDVVTRDTEMESRIMEKLMVLGLEKTDASCFTLAEQDDPLAIVPWLIANRESIEEAGFKLPDQHINKGALTLSDHELSLQTEASGDWFDIHAVVEIGDYSIPFAHFLPNIKEGDRFFKLPDDTHFVIPLLWMSKYLGLSRHADTNTDTLRIRKSQWGLLNENKDDDGMRAIKASGHNEIEAYQPSDKLKATLRPYQRQGVSWLVQRYEEKLGACLADDMGLGKTLQTIAALIHAKEQITITEEPNSSPAGQMDLFSVAYEVTIKPLRSLIIMPASLIFNWEAEINKFAPHLHTCRLVGSKRKSLYQTLHTFDVVLTSYETALRDISVLKGIDWTYIILDESQKIKNHQSKIFQAINGLYADACITLTGTPVENSLKDLWSQMQFLNPEILGEFNFFKKHYLIPIQKHRDEAVMDDLRRLIQPFILRRTKSVVAKDLPELTEQVCYNDMSSTQRTLYEKEKNAARNLLLSSDPDDHSVKFKVFASIMKLRQIANHPVLTDAEYAAQSGKYEDIKDKLSILHKAGHKTLVFSSFTGHLDLISSHLQEEEIPHLTLTGATSQKKRENHVKAFQEDDEKTFFLISIKAGGVGLNLTEASYVMILDPWWNPFIEEQAIARAHRIGQHHPVHVLRMITKETIEEKIMKLQEKKKALFKELIDVDANPPLTRQEMIDILE